MVKVLSPQEVEVFYILPAIRSELTKELKAIGLSQKRIAEILNVTEPAVSQYVSQKRASTIDLTPKVKEALRKSAKMLSENANIMQEIQKLLKLTLHERITCKKCQDVVPHIKKGCTICFNG